MGRTLAASQITDKAAFRVGIPNTINVDYVPFYDPEHPEESTERAAAALQRYIARYPKAHAVMCFEMVQGEGGFRVGSTPFFTRLMQICKENEILVLVDEIQTFARTPHMYAFRHFELDEYIDLVTIGKISQVCATLFRADIKPAAGLLSQTFTGSTQMLTTADMLLETLETGGYFGEGGKVSKIHTLFVDGLEAIAERNPGMVSGPYGLGAMIAFTPFDGEAKKTLALSHKLFENGVITFVCGANPTRIRFLPPVGAMTPEHVSRALGIVERTLIEC